MSISTNTLRAGASARVSDPACLPPRRHAATAQSTPPPRWAGLIRDNETWRFNNGKLFHRDMLEEDALAVRPACRSGVMQRWLVEHVWAAQKNSSAVRRGLERVLRGMRPDAWGLNLGSGETRFGERVLNLDLYRSKNIDIVNTGASLPFLDESLDLVISQEVLEHVSSPACHVAEVLRVLRPGGVFFCQLPFVIGYHPGPHDYWRFTKESYGVLLPPSTWEIEELERSLGHGSGFYRVLVEFLAVNTSLLSRRLYRPTKALSSLLFYPLQWLDRLTQYSDQGDRIPGGYYCIARKK